jgi:hypothetical protein
MDAAASCARWDRRAGDEPVSDQQHADERCMLRTAKSCGPDAPTLASSSRDGRSAQPGADRPQIPQATVAKEPGHRGEHEISRKTIACGNAGRSGVLVVTRVRSTNTKGTRDRGCSGHPAFPTPSKGAKDFVELGRISPRDREAVFDECERATLSAVVARHRVSPSASPMTGSSGRSSIPRRQ